MAWSRNSRNSAGSASDAAANRQICPATLKATPAPLSGVTCSRFSPQKGMHDDVGRGQLAGKTMMIGHDHRNPPCRRAYSTSAALAIPQSTVTSGSVPSSDQAIDCTLIKPVAPHLFVKGRIGVGEPPSIWMQRQRIAVAAIPSTS